MDLHADALSGSRPPGRRTFMLTDTVRSTSLAEALATTPTGGTACTWPPRVGAEAGAGEILVSAGTLDGGGAANSSPVAGAAHRRQAGSVPPDAGPASDPRSEAR